MNQSVPPKAVKPKSKAEPAGFLPKGAAEFLKKRLVQVGGFAVMTTAAGLAAALVTYAPGDPSFNTVANRPVENMLGPLGATLADQLIQWFGAASVLLVAVLLVWGGRLLVHGSGIDKGWLRTISLIAALLLGAMALAALPQARVAMLPSGFGGAAGHLLLWRLSHLPQLAGLSTAIPAGLFGLGSAVLATLATGFAFGVSLDEWRAAGRGVATAGAAVGSAGQRLKDLGAAGGKLRDLGAVALRRRPDDEDEDPAPRRAGNERREPSLFGGASTPVDDDPSPFGVGGIEEPDDEDEDDAPPHPREKRVAPTAPKAAPSKREREARQGSLDLPRSPTDGYALPPLSLLALAPEGRGPAVNEDALEQNARLLEGVLQDFGVNGEVVKVRPGPVVTLYELEPAPGTKTSRVIGLADDIARSMSALSVRIATVPGRSVIGIELPNQKREMVYLRELLASESYDRAQARLTLVLGKDIGGAPVMVDLARMPHLLVAGTTGSGKSVAINTMILSLLYRLPPEECRLIMIDPKMLELSVYDGIPHLLAPVVTEPGKAVVALKWAVREMEDRYRAMSQLGVRNIAGYNQRLGEARAKGEVLTRTVQTGFDPETGKPIYEDQGLDLAPLPYIVIIVDEMADLMLVAGKDIEAAVQRLAQMARAAGIHLIMATQRPSVDVITGTIKANFPTRISFQVTSKIDSRTILGEQGAEQLLGQGDMLYMAAGGRIMRVHGPFVSDQEVEAVVDHLRAQGEPAYVESVTEEEDAGFGVPGMGGGNGESGDDLYDQAVALVARERKCSTSFIQRHLQIGYNRAARIVERMEAEGVVSKANHVGKREVLTRREDE